MQLLLQLVVQDLWVGHSLTCLLGVEIPQKAAYDVFNKIFFSIAGLFEGTFSGLGELLVGFEKICFNAIQVFWIGG